MKTFRRLSAPGSSALSIWRLQAREEDCAALFASRLPHAANLFHLDRKTFPFDEALVWRRAEMEGLMVVECHLHGGFGVAAAFRGWMQERGWREQQEAEPANFEFDFIHAHSALAARVFAAHENQAFAQEMDLLHSLPLQQRIARVQDIQQWNAWAEVVESPPKIVLAGPPNVGKSSLFNLWNRAALATTQEGMGTTRDAVEAPLLLGSEGEQALFLLSDTAGMGDNLSALDQAAMAMAFGEVEAAWMVIWVLDQHVIPNLVVRDALKQRCARDLVVLNRCDLEATWQPKELGLVPDLCGGRNGGEAWIQQLEACVLHRLGPTPPPGALVAVKKSQREALDALLPATR